MKYIIILFVLVSLIACSKKTQKTISQDQRVNELRFESDSVPQSIKNEIINLECNSANCDSLLQCYGPFFQFLYANLNPTVMYKALDCAVEKAVLGDYNAHRMIIEYYGSPFTEKKNNAPDWAKRLRGEDAFEITLDYMRQSKGENPGVMISKAWQIYNEVIASMIIFKDNINPKYFMVYQDKFPKTNDLNEIENWITTDFIDILKKEIKEGRVIFKKYGE